MTITEAERTVSIVLASLSLATLLVSLLMSALVLRAARATRGDARRLHLQQANIVKMLLRAGFRPAKGPDWFDNGLDTQVMGAGSPNDTRWDWRQP